MNKHENIDFLTTPKKEQYVNEIITPKKRKRFFTWGKITPILIVFILVLGMTFLTRAVISSNDLAYQLGNASVFEQIKHLAISGDKLLTGEKNNRINILLLGIGGEEHSGGQLTDTMIIASLDPTSSKLGLFSIPRDLVAPIPGIGWQKINSAHAYGAANNPNNPNAGAKLAGDTVQTITGLPIHYYITLDFEGFTKIVNALGGIRVEVEKEFTDYQYPDKNFGYEPVTFEQGWQNLDGEEALKYVRSRHGTSGQGTDFARARRQQQILRALQVRATALSTLLNPNKLLSLSDIVGTHVQTDMELWQLLRLYELAKSINHQEIKQVVLSNDTGGLLVSDTNDEGSYLLRPRIGPGDFSEIQNAASNLLYSIAKLANTTSEPSATIPTTSDLPRIAIQNGTLEEGLASKTATVLQNHSYIITQITNAQLRDYEKSVIYKLTDNIQDDSLQFLKALLSANIAPTIPTYINKPDADILIIIGNTQ